MYTLWRTGHPINEEVTKAFRIGSLKLSRGDGFVVKDTAYLEHEKHAVPSVAYGILRGTDRVFKWCESENKEWWEIDRGYFGAHHYSGYYRISLRNTRAKFTPIELPRTRCRFIFEPYKTGRHILLCPPTAPVSEFFELPDNWVELKTAEIRKYSDRPIIVRHKDSARDLAWDLENAHCVVTYNSNTAIDALIRGIPAFSESPDVMGWLGGGVELIEQPFNYERDTLFTFLSHCQFTLEEFKTGFAWMHAQAVQKYGCL